MIQKHLRVKRASSSPSFYHAMLFAGVGPHSAQPHLQLGRGALQNLALQEPQPRGHAAAPRLAEQTLLLRRRRFHQAEDLPRTGSEPQPHLK